MRIVVFGAGMMGKALAHDLKKSGCDPVLADVDQQVEATAAQIGCEAAVCDVSTTDKVAELMKDCDAAISAVPYFYNYELARTAAEAGCHFCDLGGNIDMVARELTLNELAAKNDVIIVPDCGLAPGISNVVAAHAVKEARATHLYIWAGGLPQNPQPPLDYTLVFSVHGLLNEYKERALVIREGKIQTVESLTEVENIEFSPFGKLEAFQTSGGTSTLPRTYEGKLTELVYKTIRYPGYCAKMRALKEMGMFSEEPVEVGGHPVTPRAVLSAVLEKVLPHQEKDVVLLRITGRGEKEKVYEMVDFYDENLGMTAMARTTAFPTSIIAQMMADGTIKERGAFPPEKVVPFQHFVKELEKRQIIIKRKSH